MVDLSATGMRVRSLVRLQRLEELDAQLVLRDGSKVAVHGRVVWTQESSDAPGPAEFGLELSQVPEAYFTALAALFADSE